MNFETDNCSPKIGFARVLVECRFKYPTTVTPYPQTGVRIPIEMGMLLKLNCIANRTWKVNKICGSQGLNDDGKYPALTRFVKLHAKS